MSQPPGTIGVMEDVAADQQVDREPSGSPRAPRVRRRRGDGYRCARCGEPAATWRGRCDACGAWGSVTEDVTPVGSPGVTAVGLGAVSTERRDPLPTGVGALDGLLDGGPWPGAVVLVAGEPGSGKSTLVTQAAAGIARSGRTVLYIAAEEAPAQVRLRAERIEAMAPGLLVAGTTALADTLALIDRHRPAAVVVDSVHTLVDADRSGAPGSVHQLHHLTHALVDAARRTGAAVVLVGHVSRDGALAGPRVLEHLVDTVIVVEGDRRADIRMLRVLKHRHGPAGTAAVMRLGPGGMEEVEDPSEILLAEHAPGVAGSAVAAVMAGRRPALVEVQALVSLDGGAGRRGVTGLRRSRLDPLIALLCRLGLPQLAGASVWVQVTGGVDVRDPGADLAVAVAVASAATGVPAPPGTVWAAEVGLTGRLRAVPDVGDRAAEAVRLGFDRTVVAASVAGPPGTVPARSLEDAVARWLTGLAGVGTDDRAGAIL